MSSYKTLHQHQATDWRYLHKHKPVQVIAVTGGKGGVGKTNVSVNLSLACASQGKKVLLLDADLGLANIDIMLGLHSEKNLSHVIDGSCNLEDILLPGPMGINIIPSASGVENVVSLTPQQHAGLISAFSELTHDVDVMVIDTAAGISDTVVSFLRAAGEVIVVVSDEPTSIGDAYALIKMMSMYHNVVRFHLLANMVENIQEGREIFTKLCRVTDQLVQVSIDFIGAIPFDDCLRKAVKRQKAVLQAYPNSKSSREFKKIANKVMAWPIETEATGQSSFFLERLVHC